ncbi:MAG: pyocin knob domain-containing protein [Anaerovoracaceae bacterium]
MESKNINLRVATWRPSVKIHYVQYSTEIPIVFNVEDYTIPSGAEARFYLKKPSGLEIYNSCEIDGQNIILKPTAQTFAEYGNQAGQIQVVIGDDILVSFILEFVIEKNLITDSAIPSSNEFGVLDELIKEAQKAISDSSAATEAANSAAESANTAAGKANTAAEAANSATRTAREAAAQASNAATTAGEAADEAEKATKAANDAADRANDAAEAAGGTYSLVSGTPIAADTDLNTIIDTGNYRCTAPATVATLKNCPTTQTFKLYVSNTALFTGGTYKTQELYDLDGDKYERHTASGGEVWTAWEKTFNSRDVIGLANGGTGAEDRANALQNLLKLPDNTVPAEDMPEAWAEFGNFTCYYGSGSTVINKPSGYGTMIQILQTVGNALTIQQIWLGQQYGSMYVRAGNETGWNGSADVAGGDAWRLHLDDINTADYIVEEGTEGNWVYRKWNNGRAECFGSASPTTISQGTEGGLYFRNCSQNFPSGLFVTAPICVPAAVGNWIGGALTSANTSKDSWNGYIWTSTHNETSLWLHMYANGRWK